MITRPYIEYYVTLHCNLKCANCSVGSPFIDEWYSDYNSFVKDVEQLSKYMHVGIFRIIGGEPTLNPDIIKYLKYINQSSIANKTAVATNGINLIAQPKEFWEYCDIINLSIYENTNVNYDKILNFLDSLISIPCLFVKFINAFINPVLPHPGSPQSKIPRV